MGLAPLRLAQASYIVVFQHPTDVLQITLMTTGTSRRGRRSLGAADFKHLSAALATLALATPATVASNKKFNESSQYSPGNVALPTQHCRQPPSQHLCLAHKLQHDLATAPTSTTLAMLCCD